MKIKKLMNETKQSTAILLNTSRKRGVFVIIYYMKVIGPEGSVQLQNSRHGLSYRPEFKDWLKEHPHAISRAAVLIEKIIGSKPQDKGHELSEGDVRVIYLVNSYADLFKVIVGKDTFFVKRDKLRAKSVGGRSEYDASLLAGESLKGDPDIEVIDFQLGYTNQDSDYSNRVAYFVSRWENLETVYEYLKKPGLNLEEKEEIENKVSKVYGLLLGYHDINKNNMFYNPQTKKIVMFDLNFNNQF